MSWTIWLRVVAVTVVLVPFVQLATRFWAERTQAGGRHLRVLEACNLGPDGRLYLVEVGGKVYALASAAKGIQVIDEVQAPEVLTELRSGEGVRGQGPGLWGTPGWAAAAVDALRRVLGAPGARSQEPGEWVRAAGTRAVDVLQGHLARVRRVGQIGV